MKRKILLLPAFAAALGLAAWYLWLRPSPLEKARKAIGRGDPDAAVEFILKRLNNKTPPPEEPDLRRELARAYLMKGAGDNAEGALRRLLEKNPDDPYANLSLGFLFFSRGQDAFAVESFQKTKALSPGDLRASRGLLALFNFRGEHDKARAEALDLLNHAPTDAGGRLGLGQAQFGQGLFADAAQSFEAVLAQVPSDQTARRLLVRSRLGAGELSGAEEALAPLLKGSPDDAVSLSLQADYFLARARPGDAEALWQKYFEKDPRRLFAGVAWARSLAHRRETDRAEVLLLDIAQRLPKPEDVPPPPYGSFYEPWDTLDLRRSIRRLRVDFNLSMAEVYRARYLLGDAERQTRLALQMSPSDLDALRALTEVQRLSGDAAAWLKAAADAADKLPQHPDVLLDKAQSLLASKRPQEAMTFSQASAAACPSLSRAQALLAQCRLALHEMEPAAQAVRKGLALNDRDAEVHLADGLLKSSKNDWKGAEAAFAAANDLDPSLARAHWERARALERLGKNRDAQEHRERALVLEPRVYAGRGL